MGARTLQLKELQNCGQRCPMQGSKRMTTNGGKKSGISGSRMSTGGLQGCMIESEDADTRARDDSSPLLWRGLCCRRNRPTPHGGKLPFGNPPAGDRHAFPWHFHAAITSRFVYCPHPSMAWTEAQLVSSHPSLIGTVMRSVST